MQIANISKLHNSGKVAAAPPNKEFVIPGSSLRPKRGKTLPCAALCVISVLFPVAAQAACGGAANQNSAQAIAPTIQGEAILQQPSGGASQASPKEGRPPITGMWFVNFFSSGAVWDQGFDIWHSDGTEILNDNGYPPTLGNVCLGIWKQTGRNTYKLKHPAWNFDANGILLGTVVLNEIVTIEANGNTYHGSFVYDTYDLSNNLISELTGDLKAKRIEPD